jgi:hypothetical protein
MCSGIFDIATGAKIVEQSSQHGIPPQIKWLAYCPGQMHTEFITREHAGLCDLFATAGEHHLRIWSYRRPSEGGASKAASLTYKAATMGSTSKAAPAKCYTTCVFVPCEDRSYDLLSAGSNGALYLHRKGVLATSSTVIRAGRVQCLLLHKSDPKIAFVGELLGP